MFHKLVVSVLLCFAAAMACPSTAKSADGLDGIWEQYVLQKSGNWDDFCAAKFDVQRSPEGYDATTLWVNPRTGLKWAHTFSHRFDGRTWTFRSDWQNGRIAEFRLKRVSADVFIGWSYLHGQRLSRSVWLRRPQK